MIKKERNDKERLKEQARNKYRNLSEEDKQKKREYGKIDIEISLKKQKLKECQKQRYRNSVFTIKSIYLDKLTEIKA